MNTLSSGQIAELFGLPKSKLRYYINKGLLSPRIDEENGYYLFDESDIYRLYQLIIFRKIGFSISDIKASQAVDDLMPLLHKSKQMLQANIDELISLQKLTTKIIDSHDSSQLDDVYFVAHADRYFKKLPQNMVTNGEINYLSAIKQKEFKIDQPYFIQSNEAQVDVCYASKVSDYDHVYLAGNYACINFLVADEVALDLKISQFLEDPLFQLTQSKDKKILVYENVTRSLAYNSGLVYTVEVCV